MKWFFFVSSPSCFGAVVIMSVNHLKDIVVQTHFNVLVLGRGVFCFYAVSGPSLLFRALLFGSKDYFAY